MLLDLATAKHDLRVDHDDDDLRITALIMTAERLAVRFMGRNMYADQATLDAARAGARAAFEAASDNFDAAVEAADTVENLALRSMMSEQATSEYRVAAQEYERTINGVVWDETIRIATTAIIQDHYDHSGDEEAVLGIPAIAQTLLWTHRVELPL